MQGVTVTTIAGNDKDKRVNGPSLEASFPNWPSYLALGPDGAIYVACSEKDHTIRVIRDGKVSDFAGDVSKSRVGGGEDGPADQARFNKPTGIAVSSDGTVYVIDKANHKIRAIKDGQVSTFAGKGNFGEVDGLAANAQFQELQAIVVDAEGTVFVSDRGIIRSVRKGIVKTIADLKSREVHGLAIGSDGIIYAADKSNGQIKMIKPAADHHSFEVEIITGQNASGMVDGTLEEAGFSDPFSLALDPFLPGVIYVADMSNSVIRMININEGKVSTFAGSGIRGFQDSNDEGLDVQFAKPTSIVMTPEGNLLVADSANSRIRLVQIPRNPSDIAPAPTSPQPAVAAEPTEQAPSSTQETVPSELEPIPAPPPTPELTFTTCVDAWAAALASNDTLSADEARQFIIRNFKQVWAEPRNVELIMGLPELVRSRLVFDALASLL